MRQVCCLLVALLAALAIPAGASAATPTTTTVSSSKNPSAVGQSVTYTATVNPAPDGGTVAFVDNGVPISGCEARGPNTVNGETTCSATYGVNGTHSITATYSGNANFSGSSSSTLTQVVGSAGPTTSITNAKIRPKTKSATFKFTAAGATGFQCALIKKGKKHKSKPHFSSCASPKRYKHLKHGKYTFEVRAVTAAGSGPIAKKSFKV